MYKWTKFYRLKVSEKLNTYKVLIFLVFFLNLDIAFGDRVTVETVTVFNHCPYHNSAFRDIQNILYQEDFEIEQEFVYEFCGISCDDKEKGRKCYDNSYLQDKLVLPENLQDKYSSYEDQRLNRSLDPRCTYRALKIAGDSAGYFLNCESFNDSNPERMSRDEKPCLSKRFHNAIHQSITEISSCFRIDPKLFFALIVNESKGHPLAKNSTSSATGVGQLVSSYVDNYSNKSHITFDMLKNEVLPLLSQQNRTCRIVQDKVNQFSKFEKEPICQRTHHYMNMIYTMMGLMDGISQLTPIVIKGQNRSFGIPPNSPFHSLINKYEGDLEREKDRKSRIEAALIDARRGRNDSGEVYGVQGTRRLRTARELRSAFEHSNSTINNLAAKRRFFRNMARFQGLSANDRNLVSELSVYWYMLPTSTKNLFQTYVDDRRSLEFEDFTGPNGQWVRFLSIEEIRKQMSVGRRLQNYFIGYIYSQEETSSGSSSIMRGLLNRIERQSPRIQCRPY